MILVDTSAWIDFFRGRNPAADIVDGFLQENRVAFCGPIYTELLRGLRSERDRRSVLPLLKGCHFFDAPDGLWEDAGLCGFELRRKGKTVKTMDLLISCYAMAYAVPLLTMDKDFSVIRKAGFDLVLVDL